MAGFRERAEAELKGTTVEAIQAQNSAKSNKSFRERAQAELSKSSQQANTAYRAKQRRQTQQDEQQRKRQEEQQKKQVSSQMQKLNRQTNLQRVDTGESENDIGTKNYLSYRGTDPREIPVKQRVQNQIDKAKQEAMEKQAAKTHSRNLGDTILDIANQGAGQGFVTGVADTADFLANLVPNAAAKIRGEENPEHTFTGQLLKPLTDATQKFSDWTHAETNASAQRVQEDTKDSKAAQLAAEIGSGVVGAIPNAVLAMMTAGGSAASTLAPQTTGLSGTAANAVQKVAQNPSFQMSYLQTLGGAYQDAKAAGASEANATAAAFISAAANALVEVGGGLETLPGDLRAKDLSTFEQAKEWLTSALDEGKEEVVQGVISALTNKVAANSDTPYFSMNDQDAVINPARMGQEFGMGAAVGGILGGAELLGTKALNRINTQANANSNADTSVEQNSNAEMDPLEFAIQETMKPTKEQRAFDQAMEDTANWMLGKEKTATADAETGNAGIVEYSDHEAENLTSAKGIVSGHGMTFKQFVDNVKNVGSAVRFYFGKVSNSLASRIKADTGFDVDGYNVAIRSDEVIHAMKKHGNATKEAALGQIPVTAEVMEQLPTVISNPDQIVPLQTTDYAGRPVFEIRKQLGGQIVAVVGVANGRHSIEIDTVYVKNKSGSSTTADVTQSVYPSHTPKTSNGQTPIDATLDGGKLGNRAASPNVSSDASTNNTIPNSNQNVNQNRETNFDNDMGHGSVGAAELGFNPYSNYQNQTNAADFMPEGANAARPVDMPKVDPTGKQVRSGAKTIYGAEATTDTRAAQMENEYMEGLYGYDPVRDKPTLEKAKANLQEEGYDRAYARVAEKLAQVKDMKQTAMEAFANLIIQIRNKK